MINDTNCEIERIYNEMIFNKTQEERAKMGFSMFESARKIVLSTIDKSKNWRTELFLRFYGDDFNEKTKMKLINIFTKRK